MNKPVPVTCGLIYKDDKIYIARRAPHKSMPGKWEFPGGKIEPNETEDNSLKRELQEEFGMQVELLNRLGENVHVYPEFTIRLIAYRCTFVSATFELIDHDAYAWVDKEEILEFDLAEADIPLLDFI